MISPARIGWLWGAISVAAVVVAGGLYLNAAIHVRTDAFRTTAELRAWSLADRVAFELDRDADASRLALLMRAFVIPGGGVLYAQVLENGEPIAGASLLDVAIPPRHGGIDSFQVLERRLADRAVWDIEQTLPNDAYAIRLGLSAEGLHSAIRDQAILVIGLGLAVLAMGATLAFLHARGSAPVSTREAGSLDAPDAVEPFPSSPAPSPETETTAYVRQVGGLSIDEAAKRVDLHGQAIELSPKEFELLSLLAESPGRVYANAEILERVWSDSHLAGAQDVKQYVYFLRKKLEADPRNPQRIVTVRGFGYKLEAER